MLIADRATLLLLDPTGRRRVTAGAASAVLAGALLADLVLRGRLAADQHVVALRVLPGPEPVPRLATALDVVTASSGAVRSSVRELAARPLWEESVVGLAAAGALEVERRRLLLLFTSVRWRAEPAVLVPLQESVAAALTAAGVRRAAAAVDPTTVSLVALLAGVGRLATVPGLPSDVDLDAAVATLVEERELTAGGREALADVDAEVSLLVHSLTGSGSSGDGGGGDGGDSGHHGGHDGGSDGGGGDGGGGGGGD